MDLLGRTVLGAARGDRLQNIVGSQDAFDLARIVNNQE
jgi:hypothetical protein